MKYYKVDQLYMGKWHPLALVEASSRARGQDSILCRFGKISMTRYRLITEAEFIRLAKAGECNRVYAG